MLEACSFFVLKCTALSYSRIIESDNQTKKKKKLQEERRKGQRSPLWTRCEQQASHGQSLVGTTQTWRIPSSEHKNSSNFWRVQKIYDKI